MLSDDPPLEHMIFIHFQDLILACGVFILFKNIPVYFYFDICFCVILLSRNSLLQMNPGEFN